MLGQTIHFAQSRIMYACSSVRMLLVNAKGTREVSAYNRLIGQALREARESLQHGRGVTQDEFRHLLADTLGAEKPLGRLQIQMMEGGNVNVSAATLIAVADMVGVGVDELLSRAVHGLVHRDAEYVIALRSTPRESRIAQLIRGLRKVDAADSP